MIRMNLSPQIYNLLTSGNTASCPICKKDKDITTMHIRDDKLFCNKCIADRIRGGHTENVYIPK